MNFKHNWWDKFRKLWFWPIAKLSLLVLILSTFSLNLFKKITLEGAYLDGLLIDYLIPKFYLVDIFLILFLLIEWRFWPKLKKSPGVYLWLSGLFLVQIFTPRPLAAVHFLLHLCAWWLFFYLMRQDPFWQRPKVQKLGSLTLLGVIMVQSCLAIYQFIWQQPLLAYHFLGESRLLDLANISKAQFWWAEKILPYGSTAHPNILAGLIVILSILVLKQNHWQRWLKIALIINLVGIVFITQSFSALLSGLLFLLYTYFFSKNSVDKNPSMSQKILLFSLFLGWIVLLPLFLERSSQKKQFDSIGRRANLNQAAWRMWQSKPIFGVGLNQFTYYLEQFATTKETVRFVQPAHQLLLLILSEGGLYLFFGLFYLLRRARIAHFLLKSTVLLAIVSLDHYLWTQPVGLALLSLFYLFF